MATTVADSITKLLTSGLNKVESGSIEEVELRFLETAEAVLLSLVTDPNAAYYLAHRIATQALSELTTAIQIAEDFVSVLSKEPVERIDPPSVDRDFVEAKERLTNILTRVTAGAAPEESDLDGFTKSYSLFARRQLLPYDENLTIDQYTQRLRAGSEALRKVFSTLVPRLEVLSPKSFFVDSLASELPSYRTLTTLYNRISRVLESQELSLKQDDYQTKSRKALELLNEVAAVIALLNNIRVPKFLLSRHLAKLDATAADGVGPTLVGVANIDSFPSGAPAGTVPIHPALNTLEIAVSSTQDLVTVSLPAATTPNTIYFERPTSAPALDANALFTISISVLFDFDVVTYTHSFTAGDASASTLSDVYTYLSSLALTPDKPGYPTLNLSASTPGDDDGLALLLYTTPGGSTERLQFDLNDPYPKGGATTHNIWSPYGVQCSVTLLCSDPNVTTSSFRESGTSPLLTDIAAAVSSALGAQGYVNTVVARGNVLEIQTHDVSSDKYTYNGVLRSGTQPTTVSTGQSVLNLEAGPKYGVVTTLAASLAGLTVSEAYSPTLGKLSLDVQNGAIYLSEPAALTSDFTTLTVELYSKGALSYYTSLDANASEYADALAALPRDLTELEQALGNSAYSAAERLAARSYILQRLGTSTSGPLATLKRLLSGFAVAESPSMRSALAALEERGFDYALDTLLLGRVKDALSGAYLSYEEYIRRRFRDLGLGIEL